MSEPSKPLKEDRVKILRRLYENWPALLAILALAAVVYNHATIGNVVSREAGKSTYYPATVDASPLRPFKVVNAHEHLMSRAHLKKYFDACNSTGIARTLFVASSDYTIRGSGADPKKGNAENTAELIAAEKQYPERIVPFCTFHQEDEGKLDTLKAAVAAGAKGLKLYSGHGNFYSKPLDEESMLPVYEYCEQTGLPICWHVNCTKYMAEFERVMKRYPNLVVIVPHWGVTFFRPTDPAWTEFQRLMDTYPNMYTDTSFGTRQILVAGLEAVSRDPEPFREFFRKYGDRTLFGTDMVITGNKEKTTEWIADVIRACREVLEKPSFKFAMGAKGSPYARKDSTNVNGYYWGLNLDDDTLRKVYETNFDKLFARRQTQAPQ